MQRVKIFPTFQRLRLEPGVREVRVIRNFERHDERLREGGQHRLQDRLAHSLFGIFGRSDLGLTSKIGNRSYRFSG